MTLEETATDELLIRFIKAAQNNDGMLGRAAIRSLMAEAWEEGKDAGLNGGWDNPYEGDDK